MLKSGVGSEVGLSLQVANQDWSCAEIHCAEICCAEIQPNPIGGSNLLPVTSSAISRQPPDVCSLARKNEIDGFFRISWLLKCK
jgi:hypothetical protein